MRKLWVRVMVSVSFCSNTIYVTSRSSILISWWVSCYILAAGGALYTGVIRGCVTATKEECSTLNNENIPGTSWTNAYGDYCVCTSDLCNSAPQTSDGRLLIGFSVISLLTLATGRFLSQWWRKQPELLLNTNLIVPSCIALYCSFLLLWHTVVK